jgi:hypothetical protein
VCERARGELIDRCAGAGAVVVVVAGGATGALVAGVVLGLLELPQAITASAMKAAAPLRLSSLIVCRSVKMIPSLRGRETDDCSGRNAAALS